MKKVIFFQWPKGKSLLPVAPGRLYGTALTTYFSLKKLKIFIIEEKMSMKATSNVTPVSRY